jgi:molecular chaperone GrpE
LAVLKNWQIFWKKKILAFLKKLTMNKEKENNTQEEAQNLKNEQNQVNQESNNSNEEQQDNSSEENLQEKKIMELQEQYNTVNDKYLRLYSEFDNYRKRTSKEKLDVINTAGADIISNLLPVVDDFERALKSAESTQDIEALKEGVNLIYQKLLNSLYKKGLEPMKATGEEFDPELHEAITNIPAPSEDMKGKVVDEVEKGYLLNGKVIRYAKVVVGN